MDPKEYTGKEWDDLLREMNAKQIKSSLRSAMRAEAKKAVAIAQRHLASSGLKVQGDTSDWKKGIRSFVYNPSRATGFLVTVKARAASRKTGKGEKSMHTNRFGNKKPVLMWAADGTQYRKTKSQTKWFVRSKKGHRTGRMRDYDFLDKSTPEMFQSVETGLTPEIGNAVTKVARKCGFI